MTAWMQYQYMQQPKPTNATGVTVTLTALDPNGNNIQLGTTQSDSSGNFALSWQAPAVPGLYRVIASFSGSESYYLSSAGTSFTITEPSPTVEPDQPNTTDTSTIMYIEAATAAIIVAIVVATIVIVLTFRKRP
jgi:hypothetical protein